MIVGYNPMAQQQNTWSRYCGEQKLKLSQRWADATTLAEQEKVVADADKIKRNCEANLNQPWVWTPQIAQQVVTPPSIAASAQLGQGLSGQALDAESAAFAAALAGGPSAAPKKKLPSWIWIAGAGLGALLLLKKKKG